MLNQFKSDLISLNRLQIYRKYILSTSCHILSDNEQMSLKEAITENLGVEYNDIIIVGSGKLGFSIKPAKRYLSFGDDSDIDIAIISPTLFEKIWNEAYTFKNSKAYWPECQKFFSYLSYGWIRPDKLPPSRYFQFTKDWWNFFDTLTSSGKYGPYKIRAGLYHSHYFLQEYQLICISQCMEEL